ncbi:CHAT domain-containing protein [Nostoc sp.]|uniref:CHAT domain-containing protein n=1 Tax=Nostoc sp. TaxID=1180 RepID=UPI002FF152E8
MPRATTEDVMRHIIDDQPKIVHFSGHGKLNQILLVNQSGNPQPVSSESIAAFFKENSENNKNSENRVRIVLFDNCFSKETADAVAKYVDCVIGMTFSVPDKTVINFSKMFYWSIAEGKSVQDAVNYAVIGLGLDEDNNKDQPQLVYRDSVIADEVILVGIDISSMPENIKKLYKLNPKIKIINIEKELSNSNTNVFNDHLYLQLSFESGGNFILYVPESANIGEVAQYLAKQIKPNESRLYNWNIYSVSNKKKLENSDSFFTTNIQSGDIVNLQYGEVTFVPKKLGTSAWKAHDDF